MARTFNETILQCTNSYLDNIDVSNPPSLREGKSKVKAAETIIDNSEAVKKAIMAEAKRDKATADKCLAEAVRKERAADAREAKINENTAPTPASFTPNTTKPFVLKDAVMEILLNNAPEIIKYHEHKGGISSKNLRELIKAYYGKTIGLFEISKLLMLDRTFQSVGKGCYVVNEAAIPHSEPESEFAPKDEPVKVVTEPIPVNTNGHL